MAPTRRGVLRLAAAAALVPASLPFTLTETAEAAGSVILDEFGKVLFDESGEPIDDLEF